MNNKREITISTFADYEAYQLLTMAGLINVSNTNNLSVMTDAGNKIILLAEKIKAQRSVVSMY